MSQADVEDFVVGRVAHRLAEAEVEEGARTAEARGEIVRGESVAGFAPDHVDGLGHELRAAQERTGGFVADDHAGAEGDGDRGVEASRDDVAEHPGCEPSLVLEVEFDAGEPRGERFRLPHVVDAQQADVARDGAMRGGEGGRRAARQRIADGEDGRSPRQRGRPCGKGPPGSLAREIGQRSLKDVDSLLAGHGEESRGPDIGILDRVREPHERMRLGTRGLQLPECHLAHGRVVEQDGADVTVGKPCLALQMNGGQPKENTRHGHSAVGVRDDASNRLPFGQHAAKRIGGGVFAGDRHDAHAEDARVAAHPRQAQPVHGILGTGIDHDDRRCHAIVPPTMGPGAARDLMAGAGRLRVEDVEGRRDGRRGGVILRHERLGAPRFGERRGSIG